MAALEKITANQWSVTKADLTTKLGPRAEKLARQEAYMGVLEIQGAVSGAPSKVDVPDDNEVLGLTLGSLDSWI